MRKREEEQKERKTRRRDIERDKRMKGESQEASTVMRMTGERMRKAKFRDVGQRQGIIPNGVTRDEMQRLDMRSGRPHCIMTPRRMRLGVSGELMKVIGTIHGTKVVCILVITGDRMPAEGVCSSKKCSNKRRGSLV